MYSINYRSSPKDIKRSPPYKGGHADNQSKYVRIYVRMHDCIN